MGLCSVSAKRKLIQNGKATMEKSLDDWRKRVMKLIENWLTQGQCIIKQHPRLVAAVFTDSNWLMSTTPSSKCAVIFSSPHIVAVIGETSGRTTRLKRIELQVRIPPGEQLLGHGYRKALDHHASGSFGDHAAPARHAEY